MLSAAHTWSLTAIALAAGAVVWWVFHRLSDQERLSLAGRQMRAQLYALRLFADEPRLILRAQQQFLIWWGRYLILLLVPAVIVTVPMIGLLVAMDAVYSHRPLAAGESAIVTVQFARGVGFEALAPQLEGHGIAVETPAVRMPAKRQACWRVRAPSAVSGLAILRAPGFAIQKTVEAGCGLRYLPERTHFWSGPVRWIAVDYPSASINIFGWAVDWLVWFWIVSLVAVVLLRFLR